MKPPTLRSRSGWIVLLAVCHLGAITVASIPPPPDAGPARRSGTERPDTFPAPQLSPAMDALHGAWSASLAAVWNVSAPVRRAARAYTRAIGLEQRWNMFSEPPDSDQYALMKFYVRRPSSARAVRIDRALVFPARREDRFRPFNAGYYEEKAIRNARSSFLRRLAARETVTRVADLPADLLPLVRYYADRHRRQLTGGETIVRAEFWAGSAPVPPPSAGAPALAGRRLDTLRDYYEDSRPVWVAAGSYQPVGFLEREADVTWTLLSFEEWPQPLASLVLPQKPFPMATGPGPLWPHK